MKTNNMTFGQCHMMRAIAIVVLVVSLPVFTGCSRGGKVTGKVTYNGQPVKGGSVTFSPLAEAEGDTNPGKPATAIVEEDGTFVLQDISSSSSIFVGRHKVSYSPPPVELPEGYVPVPSQQMPMSPYAYLTPKNNEVQVESGANSIDIELTYIPPPQ